MIGDDALVLLNLHIHQNQIQNIHKNPCGMEKSL